MTQTILRPEQEKWLEQVREVLVGLVAALARAGVDSGDETTVRDSLRQLDELFLLVVVGEFNAGKSVFVNALLGEALLEEGVLPTTTKIQVVRHGEARGRLVIDESTDAVTAPAELLRRINIVDTPGTNALERRHEAITQDFIPRADLVFFVTSADRPFTESERAFMERIREWGKKIVVVVNKVDIFGTPEDAARVESFVRENARRLLGFSPEVFLISAREALRRKLAAENGQATDSFAGLERYVLQTLDQEERVRLKLLNPLGVVGHVAEKCLRTLEAQLQVLRGDLATIEEIEGRLAVYREDMQNGFRLRLADADNLLHQLEARGEEFIDEVVRVRRVFDLLNREKMKADFESRVVGDAPKQIEQRVEETIDWLIASDLQQWQIVKDDLTRRKGELSAKAAGELGRGFEYDRRRLIDTVGKAAQRTLEQYDHRGEAQRMAESVQSAVAGAALLEVGAVGLGTLVSIAATSTAVDVTGMLAAGVLAVLGFLVIPQRKRTARKELREKIRRLREQLMSALTAQFQTEIDRSLRRLNEGIAPYTRFVRAERQRLSERKDELGRLQERMASLRREIEAGRAYG
jgi:small GTP-binding protein